MPRLRGRELLNALMIVMNFMKALLEALMDVSNVDPVMHLKTLSDRPSVLRKLAIEADNELFEVRSTTIPDVYDLCTEQDVLIEEAVEWINDHGFKPAGFDQVRKRSTERPGVKFLHITGDNRYMRVWEGKIGAVSNKLEAGARLNHECIPALALDI